MPYATPADVLLRYPAKRVAEITGTDAVPPPGGDGAAWTVKLDADRKKRLRAALDDASAEIDSYLGRAAALPLNDPPPVLTRFAVEIAVYRLMALLDKESVEDARRRYEDIVKWLEAVASGEIGLDGGMAIGSYDVAYFAPARAFDADGMRGYL
jgi:phage gp36-like protein